MPDLAELFQNLPVAVLALVFVAGLAGLTFGGDGLLRGAVGLAAILRIKPVIIGLTVVSAATSMPEFFTSLLGAVKGSDGLAIGNIVGSNVANIGLILGISAIVAPLMIRMRLIRVDVPILIGVSILFAVLSFNSLSRFDGLLLLAIFAGYLFFLVREARDDAEAEQVMEEEIGEQLKGQSLPKALVWVLVGGIALAVGADLLVRSSVEMAGRLGVSDVLIGLTVVAVGTSLPELSASVVAAMRKQADLCAGNIVGSNLFNMLLVGGLVSVINPVGVERQLFRIEFPFMVVAALLVWPFFFSGKVLSRREGLLLLIFYGAFLTLSIFFQLRS